MRVLKNISSLLTLEGVHKKDGRKLLPEDLSSIEDAALVYNNDEIIWVGSTRDLPLEYSKEDFYNCTGITILPEIVDCHTHLIFGGDRAFEYEMRLNGADYEDIASAGGGILNTMKGTNSISSHDLFELAKKRIEKIASYGVGTIEIKSGYGLNFEKEKELTHLIHKLKEAFKGEIQIINTFMAAHAVPREFSSSSEYLEKVVFKLLKEMASENIIDAVDIFHEKNYFTLEDTEKLFDLSKILGIPFKSHADEFGDNKGALLAASSGALSCDHLLCTGDDGISALSKSETVATFLPGTGSFLGKPQANARKFLDAGCKVAIGSDYNPGSCHIDNIILVASIAAPLYKMNMAELLSAITYNSAAALGLEKQGYIAKGAKPRFSFFRIDHHSHITYSWGNNFALSPLSKEYKNIFQGNR